MRLFIGNLPFRTDEAELRDLVSQFGAVTMSNIVKDRDTGRSRGFGFVDMPDEREAVLAIEKMSGADYEGRQLTVNEAKPKPGDSNGGRNQRG
jgi:cold-inducible RNA-binding protein